MATIQDILITMSIGVAFFSIFLGLFGMYSPTTIEMYNEHNETLSDISSQTEGIWNNTHTESGSFSTGVESLDALSGALAGLTTLAITVGQSLLTTLLSVPLLFIDLLFDIITDTLGIVAPEFEEMGGQLKSMVYTVVTILIIFGVTFKILLGKPDEII